MIASLRALVIGIACRIASEALRLQEGMARDTRILRGHDVRLLSQLLLFLKVGIRRAKVVVGLLLGVLGEGRIAEGVCAGLRTETGILIVASECSVEWWVR